MLPTPGSPQWDPITFPPPEPLRIHLDRRTGLPNNRSKIPLWAGLVAAMVTPNPFRRRARQTRQVLQRLGLLEEGVASVSGEESWIVWRFLKRVSWRVLWVPTPRNPELSLGGPFWIAQPSLLRRGIFLYNAGGVPFPFLWPSGPLHKDTNGQISASYLSRSCLLWYCPCGTFYHLHVPPHRLFPYPKGVPLPLPCSRL